MKVHDKIAAELDIAWQTCKLFPELAYKVIII
jgi:hypothetical protein